MVQVMATVKSSTTAYRVEWRRQDKLKNPEKYKLKYELNKEKYKARYKKIYALNKEKIKARTNAYYHKNKEILAPKRKESGKKYRAKNKEKIQEKNRRFWAANPDKRVAYLAKRRAKHRVPKWVDKEERFLITEAYSLARLRTKITNIKWHVDHIIPLLADKASGLHTIHNLQVIPAKLNFLKNNKYEV
jgi:hypothetical protein